MRNAHKKADFPDLPLIKLHEIPTDLRIQVHNPGEVRAHWDGVQDWRPHPYPSSTKFRPHTGPARARVGKRGPHGSRHWDGTGPVWAEVGPPQPRFSQRRRGVGLGGLRWAHLSPHRDGAGTVRAEVGPPQPRFSQRRRDVG